MRGNYQVRFLGGRGAVMSFSPTQQHVQGERVFAFQLNDQGQYTLCERSLALAELDIALLTETVKKLRQGTNTSAAGWFAQAIAQNRSDAQG